MFLNLKKTLHPILPSSRRLSPKKWKWPPSAERLREDQIRFAVIAATDPLDTIFVMQFLHRRDPELQFAVFGSDLLYLRADDEVPPEGLLSVSPNPLLASREILGGQDSSTFSSNSAQNLYAACLQALPAAKARSVRPGGPAFGGPLWLTVVGRAGYWPVTLLGKDQVKPPNYPLDWTSMPRIWLVVWEIVNFFSALYVLLFWWARFSNRRTLENFRLFDCGEDHFWESLLRICWGKSKDDSAFRQWVMRRSFYLSLSMLALWMIRALLLYPAMQAYGWATQLADGWRGALSGLVFVLLVLTTLILLFAVVALAAAQRTPEGTCYGLMTLMATIAAIKIASWWYHLTNPDVSYGLFLCYRTVSLTSGVSPAVPLLLLLLAVGTWAWSRLESIAVGIRRPSLPAVGVDSNFELFDERIHTTTHSVIFNLPAQALGLICVILVWWIHFVARSRLMSIESRSFTFYYQLLLLVVLWLVFDEWLRFCFVWLGLRGVLERLEQLPFREAFTRLPKQFSGAAIWQQGGTRRSYKLLTRSKDVLMALATELQPEERALTAGLADLRNGIHSHFGERGAWDLSQA